jgi:hypothetical protein
MASEEPDAGELPLDKPSDDGIFVPPSAGADPSIQSLKKYN